MRNELFLQKAEELRPELYEETLELKTDRIVLKAGESFVFDFGNHYVGTFSVTFSSVGHHMDAPLFFRLQFAEIREELSQDTAQYHGWIAKSWIQQEEIHLDVLPETYETRRRYAFRFVKVHILSVSDNYSAVIEKVRARAFSSADDSRLEHPDFSEKDRVLDEISVRTLRSCMQEVFEDGPKRDRRLWLGDLRLEALANYETYRNYDLVKRCLYLFAGTTLEEGRLASNLFLYPEVECDYQTMFDYTLFFVNTLYDYYEATKDIETLKELEPVCERQFALLRACFKDNGRIDLSKAGMVFIDWNFTLDKEASAQAVSIYALRDFIKIEEICNKDTDELRKELSRLTDAARAMQDAGSGLFVSGEKKQVSYLSQIWMILAEVVRKEEGRELLKKVEEDEDAVKMNSPYAYHHYIQALINVGEKEKAYEKMHTYWGGMIEKGTNTFWELYNPEDPLYSPYGGIVVHSFCHAWSCTPAYFLRKYYR